MARELLLAIDKGTSVIKVAIFDLMGRLMARGETPSPATSPRPGWHEEHLGEIWQKIALAVREAMRAGSCEPKAVRAIGVSGHMGGLILVDARYEPVRPAIIWDDTRAADLVARWKEDGTASEVFSISGCALVPGMSLPVLRWVKEEEPEIFAKARYLLCMKDWIRLELTGRVATDDSDVMWMPGDIRARGYSDRLLTLLGLEDCSHLLPPIAPGESVAGGLIPRAAEPLGLLPGTPVVIGLGDAVACNVGAGAMHQGQAVSVLGTSFLNDVIVDRPIFEPYGIGFLFTNPGGKWVRLLPNTGGGSVNLRWFLDNFFSRERTEFPSDAAFYDMVDDVVRRSPPGANGVLFHPYINAAGVVAPFYSLGARAQFFGLSTQTTRSDLLRAVFEGLGLAMRDCYSAIPVELREIRVTGGASRSPVLCDILANCVGAPIVVPDQPEATALGVALIAGVGAGCYSSLEEAVASAVGVQRTHEPRAGLVSWYENLYGLYKELRTVLLSSWETHRRIFRAG